MLTRVRFSNGLINAPGLRFRMGGHTPGLDDSAKDSGLLEEVDEDYQGEASGDEDER